MAGKAREANYVEIDLNTYERLREAGLVKLPGPGDQATVIRLVNDRFEAEAIDSELTE